MRLRKLVIRIGLALTALLAATAALLTAVTSVIVFCGWVVNWMIPSLPFASASIVSGLSLCALALLFLVIETAMRPLHHTTDRTSNFDDDQSSDDDDEDDDDSDEQLAMRTAELTVAMLTRQVPERRYTASSRRK